jgi:hypothetical protein
MWRRAGASHRSIDPKSWWGPGTSVGAQPFIPPVGSRTTAGSWRTAALEANSSGRDPAGLRYAYGLDAGVSSAPRSSFTAQPIARPRPRLPPKGMDGHVPPLGVSVGALGISPGGLVRGGPLSRPLSYGVCGVTGSGRRGCRNGPRRREAERLGSGGLHGQAAPSAAVAGPHPHGLPADVLNAPRAAPGKLRTAGPAMPGDLAVAGQGADPTHEVGTVEIDAPHGVRLVSGPGSRRAPVVQAPSDALVTLKAS